MKVNFLRSAVIENRRHLGVALLASLFVTMFAFTTGVAQLKNPKRVTAIRMGNAAEGARVTIVSNAALNDYEAFRRGDRFYVKIPLADLGTAQPNFHGDGFEDIRVQKVGDGVVISFKLQPGASARVEQRSNRLDVIFAAPFRSRNNNTNSYDATAGYIGRVGSETTAEVQGAQSRKNINPRDDSTKKSIGQPTTDTTETVSPKSDSSTTVPPSTYPTYPALPTVTPVPLASDPVANGPGLAESSNWKTRSRAAFQWVADHRMASLLAALLVLSVLLFFGSGLYRRRDNVVKAKRAKAPRAQPKYSPDPGSNKKFTAGPISSRAPAPTGFVSAHESSLSRDDSTSLTAPVVANDLRGSAVREKPDRPRIVREPAVSKSESVAIATPQSRPSAQPKPSIGPSTAGQNEVVSEDQEREVFEL